jgi:hypothetical protein
MPKFGFRLLLLELAEGRSSAEAWSAHAITHYADARTEDARRRLVRASLEAGPWAWDDAPPALRDCARRILHELG